MLPVVRARWLVHRRRSADLCRADDSGLAVCRFTSTSAGRIYAVAALLLGLAIWPIPFASRDHSKLPHSQHRGRMRARCSRPALSICRCCSSVMMLNATQEGDSRTACPRAHIWSPHTVAAVAAIPSDPIELSVASHNYGDSPGARPSFLFRRAGADLRPARPQRQRQDHALPHSFHADGSVRRHGPDPAASTWRGNPTGRASRPASSFRRAAWTQVDRGREPDAPGPSVRPQRQASQDRASTKCFAASASATAQGLRRNPLRRHAAPGRAGQGPHPFTCRAAAGRALHRP